MSLHHMQHFAPHHDPPPDYTIALDPERFPAVRYMGRPAIANAEWRVRLTHTLPTDLRIMSFVDVLWGFEVTGGYDQWEPLTVIHVRRSGYAFRAGLRVNDRIVRINNTFARTLTLREAQLLIRRAGKKVKLYVNGDDDPDYDDEYTVDFWFKMPRLLLSIEDQWNDCFPWNDRNKKRYRESNCFRVRSKVADRYENRLPRVPAVPLDNAVDAAVAPPLADWVAARASRSPSRPRTPFQPVPDEFNVVEPRPRSVSPNRTHSYLLL